MPIIVKRESFTLKTNRRKGEKKFLFIIPSREIKKATDRNLIKRRMRDITRKNIPRTDKNLCYSFYLNRNALKTKFSSLKESVINAINVSANNN